MRNALNLGRLDLIWLLLMLATAATWWLGERHAGGGAALALILGIAGGKGLWVIREFMALRGVRLFWQAAVVGWLLLVLALVALAY